MKLRLLFVLAALSVAMVQGQCGPIANHVVINEFQYDDAGTDDREFVELYNPTASTVDISGWILEGLDQVYPGDNNPDFTVTGAPGSMTTLLPPGGYYVMGSPLVPNVSQVITVGAGMATTNLFENDQETLVLRDGAGAVVDTVTYEVNKIGVLNAVNYPAVGFGLVEGPGIWGNFVSVDSAIPQGLSRWTDGQDSDNNGVDFGYLPLTPGASNDIPLTLLPIAENFDLSPIETPVPVNGVTGLWGIGFVTFTVIDPTATGTNPNVIPASPASGGNAGIMWDTTGGGNSANLLSAPAQDMEVDCYVYLAAGPYPSNVSLVATQAEQWSIGVRGTTDPFGNWSWPGMLGVNNASSNTGVAWVYRREHQWPGGSPGPVVNVLYLLDENDGGDDETVLAAIPIVAGVNDGWQRLRLNVVGDLVDATFGGGAGTAPATTVRCLTNTLQCGGVYLNYREFVATNAETRPLTIDDLAIQVAGAPLTIKLDQPLGPGSIRLANRGLTPGAETFNVITINDPCPGGPGTGPLLGLCASGPLQFQAIIDQVSMPLGSIPFHFLAAGTDFTLGPFANALPAGLVLEGVAFEFDTTMGLFGQIAQVSALTTL